jgi:signal transduction histidine kinase
VTERAPKDPTTPLWRAAVLLRVLTLVFAAAVVFAYRHEYARPTLAWAVLGAMTAWTVVTALFYLPENRRWLWFTVLDLVVCCAVMAASRLALTHDQLTVTGVPLIPTVWVTGVVAVGAVRGGLMAGTGYGLAISLVNFAVRGYVDTDLSRDMVLLTGVGFVLGMASTTARRSAERLALALRAEAATAERERLARSIHDSVLQVLARVRKRGMEVGGEAAELAALAGEQEIALRTLVSTASVETSSDGTADLVPRLMVLTTERVQVSTPSTPVPLPDAVGREVVAIVSEALANVTKHAGANAKAWVLLEDLPDEVVVSVRDDGVGMPSDRLARAESEGRMGVAKSIRGRVEDLGGTADVTTAPGAGTEWEVHLPKGRNR